MIGKWQLSGFFGYRLAAFGVYLVSLWSIYLNLSSYLLYFETIIL